MDYVQSFFPATHCSEHQLKAFVADFMVALARHFEFRGRIDSGPLAQERSLAYRTPTEALALVSSLDALSLVSIEHHSFHVLIDLYEDGVELLFKAMRPEAAPWLADFCRLAQRIFSSLTR